MISDAGLFGLTAAQLAEEDHQEAARMYGGLLLSKCAVHTDEEAAEYTAEIMADIEAERCGICGRFYLPIDASPLCGNCLAYEDQAWADHRDEVAVAMAATNGTL